MHQGKRKIRQSKIRKKISGTATRPRLAVFKSLTATYAQLIDDENGVTLAATSDMKVKKGTKMERAINVGKEIAKLAKTKKIDTCVFDRGGYRFHGRVKAIADGAREEGLKF